MKENFFLSFIYSLVKNEIPQSTEVKTITSNSNALIKEVQLSFDVLMEKHAVSQNTLLLKELISFIKNDVLNILDTLNTDFFLENHKQREKILNNLITQKGLVYKLIKEIFLTLSYEEIQKIFQAIIIIASPETEKMFIQSAREFNVNTKKEIRNSFSNGITTFKINKNLLGGIRIYKDGVLSDSSWLGKLKNLKLLKNIHN